MNIKKIIIINCAILSLIGAFYAYAELPKETYHIDKNFSVVPNNPKANKKVILLTVDDGPSKNSKALIDLFKKHNIKVIFFVNGLHNRSNPGVISDIYKAGHNIGNHTWSHPNLKLITDKNSKKEIDDNTKIIKKITGENPRFFRPPYGASTPYIRNYVKENGMLFMNWSGSAKDWEKKSRDEKIYIENITKDIYNGSIILIHEHAWSIPYIDTLILKLKKDGYIFVDPKDITK